MNSKFEEGTIIKGKDLKGYILCKILSEDMMMKGFQYKMGMNEDVNPLAVKGNCKEGLHFCFIEDVCTFLEYGTKLAIISIPDDEDVYVDKGKFRTHRLSIERVMPFEEAATWEYMYENGAAIMEDSTYIVLMAVQNNYLEVVKYLHENGADITVRNNYAVRKAAQEGHLELVKYLNENGADITAWDNYAVRRAAENGHLEVVKYLHKSGADIMAEDNLAVVTAAENGHLEVVKYLYENGADITVYNNYAAKWAKNNGHLDVVKYLEANM